MNRLAVIDLGTNTFHLLIVEAEGQKFKVLYRERRFIKLAEEGIEKIGTAPFQLAISTMEHYHAVLKQFQVEQIKAFGTAALRTASNGKMLMELIEVKTGIKVQLISGAREAALIHKGVAQAFAIGEENVLIMDIGGGSVEFIIANQQEVIWAKSFPIGVAVLFHQFHKSDPISADEIDALKTYLKQMLMPLDTALATNEAIQYLIGASGTFDVLENNLPLQTKEQTHTKVAVDAIYAYNAEIIATTLAERLAITTIPTARAELLVVALILVEVVLEKITAQSVVISKYAMKEGMLTEMMV